MEVEEELERPYKVEFVVEAVVVHAVPEEEVGLGVEEAVQEHFDGVLVGDHVVFDSMQDDAGASDVDDAFYVVESFLNQDVSEPAAELARYVVYRLDRAYQNEA